MASDDFLEADARFLGQQVWAEGLAVEIGCLAGSESPIIDC
ncbi:MAG: hypothetical protein R3B96_13045 [Pirellulaceae bacterium]